MSCITQPKGMHDEALVSQGGTDGSSEQGDGGRMPSITNGAKCVESARGSIFALHSTAPSSGHVPINGSMAVNNKRRTTL